MEASCCSHRVVHLTSTACFAISGGGHAHGHITTEEIDDPRLTSITIPLRVREQVCEHRLERVACLDKSTRGLFQQHRLQRDLQCHEAFHAADVARFEWSQLQYFQITLPAVSIHQYCRDCSSSAQNDRRIVSF